MATHCQEPVISPGGVMSAASYSTGGPSGNGIGPGSLAVIFGVNLATDTLLPDPLLLPTRLGGATVIVGGIAAPLIYVSPYQINFQMPIRVTGPTTISVSTAAGTSRPYPINAANAFGVFTRDLGGCGSAAALNTAPDGALSLNSSSNSASPGDTLAIFGTGLFPVDPAPRDGVPASSSPLSVYTGPAGSTVFDVNGPASPNAWTGVSAGLVGVDQVNVRIPGNARQGCAVPLLISTGDSGNSKPVTVSIQQGGGQCSDPPVAGYGQIHWVKTIMAGNGPAVETDTVSISLQASPGRQRPTAPDFGNAGAVVSLTQNFGGQCLVPGYRSLDAGTVTVQGPGFGPVTAAMTGLGPPESGQVAGLSEYFALLPPGSIQPGSFGVTAKGGPDVPAFQANLQIGAGIHITTPPVAGAVLRRQSPIVLNWTGGDSTARVTLKLVVHHGTYDQYSQIQAPASAGAIAMNPDGFAAMPAGPVEIDLEVEPGQTSPLEASALSLGGDHGWKYIYRFTGIALE